MISRRIASAARARSVAALTVGLVLAGTARSAPQMEDSRARVFPSSKVPLQRVEVRWRDIVSAVDRHPEVRASRHRVQAAHAEIDAAGTLPNPELEAKAGYGLAYGGDVTRFEWGLSLTMPLGWLVRRGSGQHAAEAHFRAAMAGVETLRRDVLLELRILFWDLLHAQTRASAMKAIAQQTQELQRAVLLRVKQGEARPVELMRAEVEAQKVGGELEAAEGSVRAQRRLLGLWLAIPSSAELVAVADLESLPRPMSAVQARQRMRANHPAIAEARARVEALSADVIKERRSSWPQWSVSVFTDHELDRRAYGVGLSLELPVFDQNSPRIRQSESAFAAGRQELAAEGLRREAAAIEAQGACASGAQLASRFRQRILPPARDAAATLERAYELGEASLVELLDARRSALETHEQYLSVLVQAQRDCSRLLAIVGEDRP